MGASLLIPTPPGNPQARAETGSFAVILTSLPVRRQTGRLLTLRANFLSFGRIARYGLTQRENDRHYFPYDAVPAVPREMIKKYPEHRSRPESYEEERGSSSNRASSGARIPREERELMKITFWLSSLALVLFLGAHAKAQESKYVAGAKSEGRVVWYSGSNLGMARAVANAFEKKYPFMKVDLIRSSDERMLNRITTEKQAGKILFDIVNSQLLPMMYQLKVLTTYSVPGLSALDPKYKDPDGHWAGLHVNHFAVSFNTNLVGKDQAPRDWWDLLDPKWKGKIGMDPEEFDWLGAMIEYLGDEKASKLMSGLARQDIQWHKGHTQLAQLMAAGEFALSVNYAHRVDALKKQGAPIDWVRTTKPIIVNISKAVLSVSPPNPNAARLLIDYLISKEGQNEVFKNGSTPAYPGILPQDRPLASPDLVVHAVSSKITLDLNRYVKKFDELFGPRR